MAKSRSDYPALRQFLAGYLHQDFVVEHRTASRALDAFAGDANQTERRALERDVARFLAATEGRPWAEVQREFARLGGAWTPRTRTALMALFNRVRSTPQ